MWKGILFYSSWADRTLGLFRFLIFLLFISACSKIHLSITKAFVTSSGISVNDVQVTEGQNLVFNITLGVSSEKPVSVDYVTSNGSALSGTHYVLSSGTITFAPGETLKTVSIPSTAFAAEICAPDRTFAFTLSNADGADLSDGDATGTIRDPDLPSLSIASASVTEGGSVDFTATLSAPCATKQVDFQWATSAGTAAATTDYTSVNTTASIPANSTTVQLSVPTASDSVYELNETFSVSLSSAVNATLGTSTATGTINDNDSVPSVQFSVASESAAESSGTASITVSLSNPTYQTVSVPFTLTGTATGADYTTSSSPLVINPGATSGTITVSITDDAINEVDETVIMTIGTPVNATKGATDVNTLTITDNDHAKVANVTSALANGTYVSGNVDIQVVFSSNVDVMGTPILNLNTTPARYASYLSGTGTSTLVFRYPIQYADSSSDLDYSSVSAIALAGGTITDALASVNADLTLAVPGTVGSLGINKNIVINAPAGPTISSVTLPANGYYYKNDVLNFTFTFNENVTVTGTGTPTLSLDIGGTSVTASYVSGSGTSSLVFSYTVATDVYGEGPTLTSPLNLSGGTIKNGSSVDAVLTFTYGSTTNIVVDGRTLYVNFSKNNPVIQEGSGLSKTLTVTLSGTALRDYIFPLNFQGTATKATDYDSAATTVVISKGQSSATIAYDVYDDATNESKEYFAVSLDRTSLSKNVLLGASYIAKVSILDDDPDKDRWKLITSGSAHSCAIDSTDHVKCWGINDSDQLADGTGKSSYVPIAVDSGVTYKLIEAGVYVTCGITMADELKCWGYADDYTVVLDPGVSYKDVSSGNNHRCAVTTAGVLKCWGSSSYGGLGAGATTSLASPTVVDGGTSYKSVSTGNDYTCGVTTTDVLKCWGLNSKGQLGDGTTVDKNTPVIIDAGTSYKSVSVSAYSQTCGITTANELKCWGGNDKGQVGDGTLADRSLPVVIDTGVSYQSITAGVWKTCGITFSNVLKCWGENTATPTVKDSGVNYAIVSSGTTHTCGITTGGISKCWGTVNDEGQLGIGTSTRVRNGTFTDPGVSYKAIFAQCGITSSDVLKCWGSGTNVPDGATIQRPVPVTIDPGVSYLSIALNYAVTTTNVLKKWSTGTTPVTFDSGVSYVSVSQKSNHACGITVAGGLRCWGSNASGQLGDGTTTDRATPVDVDVGTTYKMVSAGNEHTCGITSTDQLKCWGDNTFGAVGDNTTVKKLSPTLIAAGYKTVSAGLWFTCGVTLTNVLKCWGIGAFWQLGDVNGVDRYTPYTIDSGTSYSDVSAGSYSSCGITTAGVLKCWGRNSYGELGTGTLTNSKTPIVSNSGTTFKKVHFNFFTACGITTANDLKCWGMNVSNETGNNLDYNLPIPVGSY